MTQKNYLISNAPLNKPKFYAGTKYGGNRKYFVRTYLQMSPSPVEAALYPT